MTDGTTSEHDQPRYEQAKAALRDRIETMRPGVKLPSLQALRDELGMSQGTIMRAINDLADDGVIERRRNRGAFVARAAERSSNILVVWPDLIEQVTEKPLSIHPSTSRILHSVQKAAEQLQKNIIITRRLSVDHPGRGAGGNKFAGVLTLFNYEREFVENFVRSGIPVVLIDPLVRARGVAFVMKDHCENLREATLSLVARGHRRILYVSIDRHFEIPNPGITDGIVTFVIEERIRGYELAMRESGLKSAARIFESRAKGWSESDKDELVAALRGMDATACCCFNDDTAVRVLNLCRERGIAVPDDLSIVGHDDAAIASAVQPALTTIQPPLDEIGLVAMTMLEEMIESGTTHGRGIILPSKLIERASVRSILT